MTRKETAIKNLHDTLISFNAIGNYGINIVNVIYEMQKKTIREIDERTEYYISHINRIKFNQRVNEYFASEHGSLLKTKAEKRQEELHKLYENLIKETIDKINEEFSYRGFETSYTLKQIGSTDTWVFANENCKNKYYLNIEIDFRTDCWNRDEIKPTINVSALGSVEMIKPSLAKDYYITVGKFFEYQQIIMEIYNKFCGENSEFVVKKNEFRNESKNINKFLSNPFENSFEA